MLLKFISLTISLLGLSEVENIIHTKTGSTEKVVILCPNGTITIERNLPTVGILMTNSTWTNSFSPMVLTNFQPVPMPTFTNWSPGSPVPRIPIPVYPGGFCYITTPNTMGLSNGIVPGLSTTLPNYPATTFQTPEAVQP